MSNNTILKIENLTKIYEDNTVALKNLSLSLNKGEILTLLGPNGAGKTTTINLIFGFTEPTSGKIFINNIDAIKNPLDVRKYIAFVSENVALYGNFTVKQNLNFFANLSGYDLNEEDIFNFLDKVGLNRNTIHKRVKTFSKGMRQRLGIAVALVKNADLIVLDEPTSGLDPKGGIEFLNLLDDLRKDNKAILMTTHDVFRAEQISDRIAILNQGEIVKILTKRELGKENLTKIYLNIIES